MGLKSGGLTMKTIITSVLFLLLASSVTFAQKFAYVDSQYILENIPEYKEAQQELDRLSEKWQKEIEAQYGVIDRMYKSFRAEQILLTEDMKTKREEEIIQKEREVKELQKRRFGVDGELFKKRQELIQPIQDKIYTAIKTMATSGNYMVVFDKADNSNILFANERYDKSDNILKKLGYSAGEE